MKSNRNVRGNALFCVLVAPVIGGLVITATYKAIQSSIQNQKLVNGLGELSVLRSQIQGIISSDTLCGQFFKDSLGDRAKFNPLLPADPTGNTLSQLGLSSMIIAKTQSQIGALYVDQVLLSEIDPGLQTIGNVGAIPVKRIVAKLQVSTRRGNVSAYGNGGSSNKVTEFPLWVETNNSGGTDQYKIVRCSTSSYVAGGLITVAQATRYGANGSLNDSGLDVAVRRPIYLAGTATRNSFIALNGVSSNPNSPSPSMQVPSTLDGIKCNEANGWFLSGCFIAAELRETSVYPYPNGCVTKQYDETTYEGTFLTITCIKSGGS